MQVARNILTWQLPRTLLQLVSDIATIYRTVASTCQYCHGMICVVVNLIYVAIRRCYYHTFSNGFAMDLIHRMNVSLAMQ